MTSGVVVPKIKKKDPGGLFLQRPVISIGNISMGGRGKTPVTALIAFRRALNSIGTRMLSCG